MGPSRRNRLPNVASQMRIAFANIASKTGSRSPGELEITFSTSDVAVCCSSASFNSRLSRATSASSPTGGDLSGRAAFCAFGRFGGRFSASRFERFATCAGAPCHRLPRGSGRGIVSALIGALEVAQTNFVHLLGNAGNLANGLLFRGFGVLILREPIGPLPIWLLRS